MNERPTEMDFRVREAIAEGLARVYGAEGCAIWLLAPHPMLDGDTPAGLLENGQIDEVLGLIDQMVTGAFISMSGLTDRDLLAEAKERVAVLESRNRELEAQLLDVHKMWDEDVEKLTEARTRVAELEEELFKLRAWAKGSIPIVAEHTRVAALEARNRELEDALRDIRDHGWRDSIHGAVLDAQADTP